jgi:hypothetical protein
LRDDRVSAEIAVALIVSVTRVPGSRLEARRRDCRIDTAIDLDHRALDRTEKPLDRLPVPRGLM